MSKSSTRIRTAKLQLPPNRQAVVAETIVDDPYELGAKLKVSRNLREHPLHTLKANGRLDDAQILAGELFRRQWERAAVGKVKSVDLSVLRVDGGGPVAGVVSDGAAEAIQWLNRVARQVGPSGFTVLKLVAGEGRGLTETVEMAKIAKCPKGRAGDGYILGMLTQSLELILDYMGNQRRSL